MGTLTKSTIVGALALTLAGSVPARAQRVRGVVVPRAHIYAPFPYDPLWGPYYAYGYPYAVRPTADVRVHVTPKQTGVYVDGYYAGVAGDFDGVFKRLRTTAGGHAITLHLEGYRTVTQNIYVRPDSTYKMDATMNKLAAGEASTPPPSPHARQFQQASPR